MINNGKSNNGNPCPKTLDTKTQLQQQTVANAAETINKKCNYFYINSNTRPIREWMITQEHIRACVCQQYFLKRLLFSVSFQAPWASLSVRQESASASDRRVFPLTDVGFCDVPFKPGAGITEHSWASAFKKKWVWNELTQRYGSGSGEERGVLRLGNTVQIRFAWTLREG